MTKEGTDRLKRMMIGRYAEWVTRFDESEYLENPPLIRKLFEEKQIALTSAYELEKQHRDLENEINDLRLENQRLSLQLREVSRKSNLMFSLALVATILLGIGVNLATSSPSDFAGWIMILAGCTLEAVAYLARPTQEP